MPVLSRHIRIAIYHQKNVYKANLLFKNNSYESSFVGEFNIDEDFYCALIDTEHNNRIMLTGSTYNGCYFNDASVFNEEVHEEIIEKDEDNVVEYDECLESCDKCNNCKYKEFFYSQSINIQDSKQDDNTNETHHTPNILEQIIPQFDYIFEHYEKDEILTNLIPNSRFVRTNENGENYSIGALYDNDDLKVICYAVMCDYKTPAPESLGKHYQWLPIDRDDPMSDGYYIVFQDAKDLKILEL